ncbi:hypothetical protein ACFW6V_36570 [Streptomyces sp. NPDC058734]|uniref:hypothetical protein n=1 Tax=Streptomyces sp. NPDC058734 TaxID=3346615 RepID=UPI0036AAAD99
MMNRIRGRSLLTSAIVSSVVFAPLGATSAAVGTPSRSVVPNCSLTEEKPGQAEGGKYKLRGNGFTGTKTVQISGKSGSSQPAAVSKGAFEARGLAYDTYTVMTSKGLSVTCSKPAEPGKASELTPEEQYSKGHADGLKAMKESCENTKPKQGAAALDPNYEKGHMAGVADAIKTICKDAAQKPGGTGGEIAVTGVSARVNFPQMNAASCFPTPPTEFTGAIAATGPGTVSYRWIFKNSNPSQEFVANFTAEDKVRPTVSESKQYDLTTSGKVSGWAQIEITSGPSKGMKSNQASFEWTCPK